jgi:hypothetical protein
VSDALESLAAHSDPEARAKVVGGHRYSYERRRPELGTLHRVVRENLHTLYAAVEHGSVGVALPNFVKRELESYLACGLLCRGFAILKCAGCDERRLVAFSCCVQSETIRSWSSSAR